MGWHSIDFQGIVALDSRVVDQLEKFLDDKESRLAMELMNMITPFPNELLSQPILPPSSNLTKLNDAVEIFTRKVRSHIKNSSNVISSETSDKWVDQVNELLWDYTETLEASVIELFQQLTQINLEKWSYPFLKVIQGIKDLLLTRLEDLLWTIKRLEKPLQEICSHYTLKNAGWKSVFIRSKTYIDADLQKNIRSTEKCLESEYAHFATELEALVNYEKVVDIKLSALKQMSVLATMELPDYQLYLDLYRLIKILEVMKSSKGELAQKLIRGVKLLSSVENVMRLFRGYFKAIKDEFFQRCIDLKSYDKDKQSYADFVEKIKSKIKDYQVELSMLIQLMTHYRLWALKSDSDPYVRTRLGFSEWIVGPEPDKIQKFIQLIYEAEEFNRVMLAAITTIEPNPLIHQETELHARKNISKLLHELGQPLISESRMVLRATELLKQILLCDEVGSPYYETVSFVGDVLGKTLRADWKYHSMHGLHEFYQVYATHQGLLGAMDDPTHAFRLDRFRLNLSQLSEWIKKKELDNHLYEEEAKINDIKIYLQDFLATVQRLDKDKENGVDVDARIRKLHRQLLDYRYLFGSFFYLLVKESSEGYQQRCQFLFVDQYFETVEGILYELKERGV